MKSKIFAIIVCVSMLYACGSKVAVSAQKPDPVQVPPTVTNSAPEHPNTENMASGKSLYEGKCANCHRLFSATEHSKEEWVPILARMQKKARLDDSDMALINGYIFSQLK